MADADALTNALVVQMYNAPAAGLPQGQALSHVQRDYRTVYEGKISR